MRCRIKWRVFSAFLCLNLWTFTVIAQSDEDYEAVHAPGFDPNGSYFAFKINEHVNTFNGNLIITQQDLYMPGRNGMGVKIVRVYNSNVWKYHFFQTRSPSYLGLGWDLHFGMIKDDYVYLPDGSRQRFGWFYDSVLADTYCLTEGFLKVKPREYVWEGNYWSPDTIWTKDGKYYIFEQIVGSPYAQDYRGRYVTKIKDTHENYIYIEYYGNSPYIKRIINVIDTINFIVNNPQDSTARLDKIVYKDSHGNPIEINYIYDDEMGNQYTWGNPLVKVV